MAPNKKKLIRFVNNFNCSKDIKDEAIDLIESGYMTAEYEISSFITNYPESKGKYDVMKQKDKIEQEKDRIKEQRKDAFDAMFGYVKCPKCATKVLIPDFCPKCDTYIGTDGYILPDNINHPHFHSSVAKGLGFAVGTVLIIVFVIGYLILSFLFNFFDLMQFAIIAVIAVVIFLCLMSACLK